MTRHDHTPPLYRNLLSYVGGLLVLGGTVFLIAALISQMLFFRSNPYAGIITFMVLPLFVGLGGVIFLWGMRRESLRRRRLGSDAVAAYPALDLNVPRQRRRFAWAMIIGIFLVVVIGVAGYHGFLFTESVTFCGQLCHSVMQPEHTAYLASPHARVTCVQCHVGEGADWYVKAKVSGLRQVLAVTFNTYRRPIEVPISNLRPAREICEECHWPNKFYGSRLLQQAHFRYDEANTAEQISMAIKTGGGSQRLGQSAGIHWHMLLDNRISYVATDHKLQEIPYFEINRPDGTSEEYLSQDFKGNKADLTGMPRHIISCIDCHNRPTHIYVAPEKAVDTALASKLITASLPWIKKVAVDALVREYGDTEAAHAGIRAEVDRFYATSYAGIHTSRANDIDTAVKVLQGIWDRSVFPAMKVNWTSYADNIGHRNWPGCFRCHDGRHATASGKVLSNDCDVCHTMPQRGPLTPLGATVPASTENWHPWELKGRHATMLCNQCHAAGFRPPTECADCHKLDKTAPMMASGCETCHAKEQEVQPINDCRTCHETLPGLHAKHGDAVCTDCHDVHVWKVKDRDACLTCHDDRKDHNPDGACASCHEYRS